jgi:hypothetical protein
MLRFCGVRALSVSPQHRRLGIASTLLKLIKQKAAADRMLWIMPDLCSNKKEKKVAAKGMQLYP